MSPRFALGVILLATTCCARPAERSPLARDADLGSCAPLFGSDDVLVAPNDPRGLADSGLIVIAKWDGARWRDCGVTQ